MVNSQRGALFKRLVARLLLVNDKGQQVLYATAKEARDKGGVPKVNSEPPGRMVELASLAPFFADERSSVLAGPSRPSKRPPSPRPTPPPAPPPAHFRRPAC